MSIPKNQLTTIDDDDDDNDVAASVSDGIQVPIICLSDDSDSDDDVDDKEYTNFLDNLRDEKKLGPVFESNRFNVKYEVDNGVFDIRKFGVSSKTPLTRIQRDNREKIKEDIQRDNRAVERRRRLTETMAAWPSKTVSLRRTQEDKDRSKRKFAETMAAETSKDLSLVIKQEDVERYNSVGEQRKRKFSETEAADASWEHPLVTTQEDIQRDNGDGEQRKMEFSVTMAAETSRAVVVATTHEDYRDGEQKKRKFAETMAAETSGFVLLATTQEDIERDNSIGEQREVSETMAAETSRGVLVATTHEDNRYSEQRKRKFAETMAAETSRSVLFATTQEDIEKDNSIGEQRKREVSETMAAETSRAVIVATTHEDNRYGEQRKRKFAETMAAGTSGSVLLAKTQGDIERDNSIGEQREMVLSEREATVASEDVPLITTQEDIQRSNSITEWENKKLSRTKARGSGRVVVASLRVNKVEWLNSRNNGEVNEVNETSKEVPVTHVNKGVGVRRKKKADEDYMRYLEWLVPNLKAAVCEKHPSSSNQDTPKESTVTPEMNLLPVKIELDTESWSDSEVLVLGDSPYMNGEATTPFVVSKSEKVIEIDESINPEDEDQSSHWFKEKLMDILARPYDEKELSQLSHEVSIHKQRTRCRELRDGREHTYATDTLASSYLDIYPDFTREYKPIQTTNRHKALKLLRGFFFYLKNVAHEGAFKPWLTNNFS